MSNSDEKEVQLTIRARFRGWPVEITLSASPAKMSAIVDKLEALGFDPDAMPTTNGRAQRAPLPDVIYSADGKPCCPWHKIPLSAGKYGYYCSAREDDPARATPKGYCRFSVKEL